ncbi:MAG: hypothetical protein NVSMB19_00640 [Vulcanimicrobiaceae bacterium]
MAVVLVSATLAIESSACATRKLSQNAPVCRGHERKRATEVTHDMRSLVSICDAYASRARIFCFHDALTSITDVGSNETLDGPS